MGDRFVYVLAERPEGPVKIGLANCPEDRIKDVRRAYGIPNLQIHYLCRHPLASQVETWCHYSIQNLRIDHRREWFDMTVEEAGALINELAYRWDINA